MTLPQPIRLVRVPQLCSERETADHVLLTCHVRPHPFPPGADGRLRLSLSVSDLAAGTESLTLGLNVTSAGQEVAGGDNVRNFTLRLRTEADIAVTGSVESLLSDRRPRPGQQSCVGHTAAVLSNNPACCRSFRRLVQFRGSW